MLSIQTNVNAMVAQENLRVTTDFQGRTIARLTSGYRINQSGDDAAGLAVANKYRSEVSELTQGVRNANDGLSTLQIIDGGLNNVSKILDRLKTLATQSATDTFTGDRNTLNNEYQDLLSEINRQADHIHHGYEIRGAPENDAERRAWATVNKMSGGGKKSGLNVVPRALEADSGTTAARNLRARKGSAFSTSGLRPSAAAMIPNGRSFSSTRNRTWSPSIPRWTSAATASATSV